MALQRLSKRETKILAFCIFMIFCWGALNLVFKPLLGELRRQDDLIYAKERELSKDMRIADREKNAQAQYQQYSQLLQQQNSDEQQMASILTEIETAANANKMRVSDVKPQKVRKEDFYNVFTVSLSLEDDFGNIMRFLYTLQNPPYQFQIDELRLQKRSLRSSKIRCRFILSRTLIP